MYSTNANYIVTLREIKDLRAHPRQGGIFANPSEEKLQELANDLAVNGLQHPIEILPDGTVICGHQRVRAAKRLGWKEIPVRAREDLEQEGPDAVLERLITDNLNRRQLDKLEQARCYRKLKQIAPKLPEAKKGLYPSSNTDLRDRLSKQFKMSGRNLDRYERILDAPIEVQKAFSNEQLTLIMAEKVAGLGDAVQEQIAGEIKAGGVPKVVVQKHLPQATARHKDLRAARNSTIKRLSDILHDLDGRADKIVELKSEEAKVLERAQGLCQSILERAKVYTEEELAARTMETDEQLATVVMELKRE